MPAETVYGEQGVLEVTSDQAPMVPVVEVRWGRDGGYVQVVSKATDAHGGRYAGDSPETHVTDGMYVDLGRDAINKLIRNLRRSRDQAFGRDE